MIAGGRPISTPFLPGRMSRVRLAIVSADQSIGLPARGEGQLPELASALANQLMTQDTSGSAAHCLSSVVI